MPRISLIVPTINRTQELARLLDSLCVQTYRNFEVIVVDQNPDDRVAPLVEQYSEQFPFIHVRSEDSGASRARNAGFGYATGEILAWPDDDCWYPPDLLEKVSATFDANPELAGAIGLLYDENGKPHQRWIPKKPRRASMMDAFTLGAEPVLFFRKEVVGTLGGFDEELGTGAGTPWGAGEGTDLCVRVIKENKPITVQPHLTIFHSGILINPSDEEEQEKSFEYALGMGAVLRKNKVSIILTLGYLAIYIRALIWSSINRRWAYIRYHWGRFSNVCLGYKRYD